MFRRKIKNFTQSCEPFDINIIIYILKKRIKKQNNRQLLDKSIKKKIAKKSKKKYIYNEVNTLI